MEYSHALILAVFCLAQVTHATGNVDPAHKFARREATDWASFSPAQGGVTVHANGDDGQGIDDGNDGTYEEAFTVDVSERSRTWSIGPADWPLEGLRLVREGDRVHIYQGGGTKDVAPSRGTEDYTAIVLTGRDGKEDELVIDYSGGDPIPSGGIYYEGGAGGYDTLTVRDGAFAAVTHTSASGNDGTIDLNGKVITYTGLEPVNMSGSTATDFIFNLPAGTDNAQLSHIGGGNLRIESTDGTPTFEQTDFAPPSGSITINGGTGNDTLAISGAVTTACGFAVGSLDGGITIAAGSVLDLGGNNFAWSGGTNVLNITGGGVLQDFGAITEAAGDNTINFDFGMLGTGNENITVDTMRINPFDPDGGLTYTRSGGALTVNGDLQLGGEAPTGGNNKGNLTQNGGTTVVGNLLFGGANNREGGTYDLNGGTLTVNGDVVEGAVGTPASNVDSAQLYIDDPNALTVAGNIQVQSFRTGDDQDGSHTVVSGKQVITTGTLLVGRAGVGTMTIHSVSNTALNMTVSDAAGGAGSVLTLDGGMLTVNGATDVGDANGSAGTIDIINGAMWTNTANVSIGQAGTGGGLINVEDGSLTVTGGGLNIAGDGTGDAGTTGAVVVAANGQISVRGNTEVGRGGTGFLTIDGGTYNQEINNLVLSQTGGSGGGTVTINSGTLNVGDGVGQDSDINFNGGTRPTVLNHNGGDVFVERDIQLGSANSAASRSTYTLDAGAGSLTVGDDIYVGKQAHGEFNIESGTFSIGGSIHIAGDDASTAARANADGTVNIGVAGGNPTLDVNQFEVGDQGVGVVNHSNGTVNVNGANNLVLGQIAAGNGTYNMGGGTLSFNAGAQGELRFNAGTGVFNQVSGLVDINGNRIAMTSAGTGDATYNLMGGTLDLGGGNVAVGAGTETFTFTGGTLKDVGSFGLDLAQDGGILQLGADGAADTMTVSGALDQSAGSLEVDLDGTAGAGVTSGHDHLTVNGTVTLDGDLVVSLDYAPSANDTFVIIANDGADAVTGTFSGLPEGDLFDLSFGGVDYTFQITYQGGDGNDVVLVVLARILALESAHGTASPAVGIHTNLHGAVLTNTVTSPDTFENVEYVCTGWTMTGNAPASGATNEMTMVHTNDATLTWLWQTNAVNDFGDLPAAYAITRIAEDGARHFIPDSGGVWLGTTIDAETNGLSSATADGDDVDGASDEDGIVAVAGWQEGPTGGALKVTVTGGSGYLSGWIDWDGNNQFTDAGDQVFNMAPVAAGVQTNAFAVPAGLFTNSATYPRFARFRLWTNSTPALVLTGLVENGEVEDYELPIVIDNVPPVVTGDVTSTVAQVGAVIDVLGNDSDADGDSLSITNVTQGARGAVAITGGGSNVTYTANVGEAGYDSFTYWVSDGQGGWATGVVAVAIDPQVVYVSESGSNVWPYADWVNAATQIQEAVDAVVPSGMVWVTNGTYAAGDKEVYLVCRVALTKPVRVQSINGPNHTTIVGQAPAPSQAMRCAYLTNGTVLAGFTLSNGVTMVAGSVYQQESGGAVLLDHGGMLSNCIVMASTATIRGGGVFCDGGGIVQNCTIRGNSAGLGGGVSLHDGSMIACEVWANSAITAGGGVHVGSPGLIRNCLVVSNSAPLGGGMSLMSTGAVSATVQNCTVCSNTAVTAGGGISCSSLAAPGPSLINTIICYNSAPVSQNWAHIGPATYTHNCTTPTNGLTGVGNIADEPKFARNRRGGYRLRASSPCKNTGLNEPWMGGALDLVGALRIVAAVVDRGCYEYPNATDVVLYQFWLTQNDGEVVVRWQTASEVNTLGFMLYRRVDGAWGLVNTDGMIPAKGALQGGIGAGYAYVDSAADRDQAQTYKLVEVMMTGTQEYGPFERAVYEFRLVSPLRAVPDGIAIHWLSREGDVYRVYKSLDLRGDFEPLSGPLPATPPENVYIDRLGGTGRRYYQIRLQK